MNANFDILCIGSNCTQNYGDRAIYAVLRNALESRAGLKAKRFPLKPIYANRHGSEISGLFKLLRGVMILPGHYFQLWRRARRAKAVVIGGGNLLHDVFPLTAFQVFMCALMTRLAMRRFVMFGIGAGPIDRWWTRFLIGLACCMSSGVTVRDSYSMRVLQRCPLTRARLRPRRCRDVVFAMERKHAKTSSSKLRISFSTMMYMHPERWPKGDVSGYELHLERCCNLVRRLVDVFEAEVILFSNEPSEDQTTVDAVYGRLDGLPGVTRVHCRSLDSAMRVAGDADVHIGSRLHSLIFSLTQGTPAVALSSHGRMSGLFEDLSASDMCFEIGEFEPQVVVDAVASLRDARGVALAKEVDRFKEEVETSLNLFCEEMVTLSGCNRSESKLHVSEGQGV